MGDKTIEKVQGVFELNYEGYVITTDKTRLQTIAIHKWLSEKSHWAKGMELQEVIVSFQNSFCIGILHNSEQIGYARLVTDYSRFGYLMDVYVEEEFRGRGLGKKMIEVLLDIDWIRRLPAILLSTRDADRLYRQFGFHPIENPARLMKRTNMNKGGQ